MESTSNKILAKIKRFGLEMFSFGSSRIFLKNFAGILGMLLLFFFMTTTWLKCYTDHGEALRMPNYVGINLLEVKEIAKKKGFAIVVDSAYVEGMAPLTITDQHPKAENLIKEKRTVYLTVIQKGVQMVKLPSFKDEYIIYVKPLTGMGIKYNSTTEVDTRVAEGTILDVIYNEKSILDQLKDNTMEDIPSGSKLKFIVSEKGYGNTRVPNLICKTTAEAQLILENLNLNENIIRDATVSDKTTAYVWWQDPAAGSSIRFGEQVKIQIMQNIPDDCEENELEAPREDAPEKPQDSEDNLEDDDENEEF